MLVSLNTVNSVYNKANSQGISQSRYTNLAPLSRDTVSFGASVHRDLMSLSQRKILEVCRNALKEGISLGEGQEAVAYKIESFPEYCIRRAKKGVSSPEKFSLDKNLNEYDALNHVVAKLDEGTQLMRYIPGIPLKITHKDSVSGIQVKKTVQGLVANEFKLQPFKKVIAQVEDAKSKGIDFDRKGENLHVDPLSQEMICIDFSPNFHDIEYNPISYIYSALGIENTEHAPMIFGKLCKAYAQRLMEVPVKKLNLEHLDLNFYHRGFIDDPFNEFPDKKVLEETKNHLQRLIESKKDSSIPKEELERQVQEFEEYVDDVVVNVKKRDTCSLFWEEE